jgi:hypothetical protein
MDKQHSTCVVLLEHGATWRPRYWGLGEEAKDAVVVRQEASESDEELLGRLATRCSERAASGIEIGTAVYACNRPPDESRLPATMRWVNRLRAQLTASRGAKLLLVAEPRKDATLNGLLTLGGTFIEDCVAAGLSVEVRCGPAENASWPRREAHARPRRALDMARPGTVRTRPRRRPRAAEPSSSAR